MNARLGWEVLRMGLSALARSRMRTFLSVLGVVIGVAAFVTMTAVGSGASRMVSSRIASLGTNLLIVTPGSTGFAALYRGSATQQSTLTYQDAMALSDRQLVPDVTRVAPNISRSQVLRYAGNSWSAQVSGTAPELLGIRNLIVAQGRFLQPRDMKDSAPVIVLGAQVLQALFPGGGSPLGKFVDVGPVPFRVVGVLASVGAQGAQSQDNTAYVPITTAFLTLFPADTGQNLPQILLSARSQHDLTRAAGEVTAVLVALHHLVLAQQQPDFTVTSQTQFLATAKSIATTLSLLLAASATIALLVGGIGIMNIMTVSVAERTREIGIRKAVGATSGAILLQFFLEAVLISVGGGLLGLGGGLATALVIPHLVPGITMVVSPGALELGLVVSLGVGVVFGYYPARRAMALDPIDALAHE